MYSYDDIKQGDVVYNKNFGLSGWGLVKEVIDKDTLRIHCKDSIQTKFLYSRVPKEGYVFLLEFEDRHAIVRKVREDFVQLEDVLVRDCEVAKWTRRRFILFNEDGGNLPYWTTEVNNFETILEYGECIPFKGNEKIEGMVTY